MSKRKIIIDCDPGIDDAYAIALALKEPSFEVLAIHTVSGNVSVQNTTRNTRGLLKVLKSEVPIYQGSNRPLVLDPIFAADVHGHNGFAGYEFSDTELNPLAPLTSLQAYYQILSEASEPVTIIAVGPLTNVALLLMAYPELKNKIGLLSIMGGGLKGGNITVAGEFNFYVDPQAAKIVFESSIPIIMAGLDVTEKARLYAEDVTEIAEQAGAIGKVLAEISAPGLSRGPKMNMGHSITPNDTVSVLVLTNPDIFKLVEHEIHVMTEGEARGLTVANTRLRDQVKPNSQVIMGVDELKFRELLKAKLKGN